MIRDVVAVIGDRAAAFELGIACQVFGLDRSDEGLPTYDFALVTARPGPVATTSAYSINVPCGPDRMSTADLIVVPAWPQLAAPPDPALLGALRGAVDRGAQVVSICSGAFLLAAAGLLDGRRAATHWQFAEALRRAFPLVQVDASVLYVVDRPVLTSAGAAAGIDACLQIVRTEHGAAVANALARRMVVPAHRAGGQAQYVQALVPEPGARNELAGLLDWIEAHIDEPLTVPRLASQALMSPRTFARRFRAVTGTTPHRYLLERRLRLAEQLLETSDQSVDAVAGHVGFGCGDTLRHHFSARRGVGPAGYRRTFRAEPDQNVQRVAPPGATVATADALRAVTR